MRWAIVTSNHVRHRFLANTLASIHSVAAVVSEPKRQDPSALGADDDERSLIKQYFADRSAAEASMLPEGTAWALPRSTSLIDVGDASVNGQDIVDAVTSRDVDACVIFGSSILKRVWFDAFEGHMLNVHLGLSPFYRGSGTNFWPLYDARPELVGATLHQLSPLVDAGDIYCQIRPTPFANDTPHTLGNRTIRKATFAMAWLMPRFERGEIAPTPMPRAHEREYRVKDFDGRALNVVLRHFAGGMMPTYCADESERRSATPLINEWDGAVP